MSPPKSKMYGQGEKVERLPLRTRGGGGVSRMLTIADKGGWGQKNVQKKKIMGTENVDKENN